MDFMGPFPSSYGNTYILVAVDYVSKWIEAKDTTSCESGEVAKFLKSNIFNRYGVPMAVISDQGTHFQNRMIEALMKKYGVHHRLSTPYHPQSNGQAEISNREIKAILDKTVNPSRKDWSMEHGAYWAVKEINMNPQACEEERKLFRPWRTHQMQETPPDLPIPKEVCFYEVGRLELQVKIEQDVGESKASMEVEEMKAEVSAMHKQLGEFRKVMGVMSNELGDIRKEMAGIRTELGGVREDMHALKGHVTVMVGKSSTKNDRMAEAVQLMMMMTKWLKENFSEPQAKLTTGPSKVSTQPGPGSSSPQHPPPASKPLLAPSASKTLTVKKTLTKQPSEEVKEKPDSPARKKAKVTRPYVPPQVGSRGSQTPKCSPLDQDCCS
ncbi:uncharacterized protein LOC121802322 [Salvia splendens]|uniref:uncharacterized protein LOC121802322 n=1 Tax=Salvia splendens TaxID=180675 RepID=UPI001C27287D|nr:uncharacterized protein LOC121802322 [Salvia splendens]